MEGTDKEEKKHFVLVHGACHGAWCWHKVTPRLESCGHRVTLIDLAASGKNKKEIHEVHSFYEYSEPLLEVMSSLGPNEKVILVGHSLGGLNIALAMEMFPKKVSVAVFLTAFMPGVVHHPSYIFDKDLELAITLSRPGSLFREDLSQANKFTEEAYCSICRIFVVCKNDEAIPEKFQRWMITNGGVKEVMEIKGADHMPMFSKVEQLCNCLLDIANRNP